MTRVFISGVAGFLGSWLAEDFLAKGFEVAGADTLLGGYKSNVPEAVEFAEADCSDFEEVDELLEGCDVVYHCAAAPYEGLSVFSPSVVFDHTLSSTVAMLVASINAGVKRFVFFSSMSRYGSQETPFTEDMAPAPADPPAQLVELGQAETFGAFDQHDAGVRHVDADFDDCCRN